MSTVADHQIRERKPGETPPPARPSASVLLISPTNQILLLHRVSKASSFASAHVFPGGALSKTHDGAIPDTSDPARHQDGPAYRMAAIRETFEESGILLATSKKTGKLFTEISDSEREEGRRAVHAGTMKFSDLMEKWGAVPDVDALIPFTRWITPIGVPKRFSTQMYIYFLPLGSTSPTKHASSSGGTPPSSGLAEEGDEIVIPNPTHDGGIEHTAARFLPPNKWLDLARQNRIILFPPQFFLIYLLAPFLSPTVTSPSSPLPSLAALQLEREAALDFLHKPRTFASEPEVSFAEACISPVAVGKGKYGDAVQDGIAGVDKNTAVLTLESPGPEVEGMDRKGLLEWVVTTAFRKEGPRNVGVRRREEVLGLPRVKGNL